ncbi:MAG: hypothetical protein ACFCUQ_05225 [Kiloniellales bacterium]
MQKSASNRHAADAPREEASAADAGVELVLLSKSPYLQRLRTAVTETYASMLADRVEAVDAVEKTIAALARPEVPLDPALKSALIAKLGELLTKLERLHAMLPRGETLALQSLDKAGELLDRMERPED